MTAIRFPSCLFAPAVAVWAALLLAAAGTVSAQAPLRPGDSVLIRLSGVLSEDVNQFSASYTVDSNGFVNLPYIGQIRAAGLLPAQLAQSIESKLKVDRIYTQPTITVSTEGALFVNVGGAVRNPTRIPYTPDMTLLTAINAAGDFNDFANQGKVRLRREGKETVFNAKEIRRKPDTDPKLLPGDQIEVDESFF